MTSFLLYNVLLAAPLANPYWKPKGREPIVVAHEVQSPKAQGMVKMGEESICRRKMKRILQRSNMAFVWYLSSCRDYSVHFRE